MPGPATTQLKRLLPLGGIVLRHEQPEYTFRAERFGGEGGRDAAVDAATQAQHRAPAAESPCGRAQGRNDFSDRCGCVQLECFPQVHAFSGVPVRDSTYAVMHSTVSRLSGVVSSSGILTSHSSSMNMISSRTPIESMVPPWGSDSVAGSDASSASTKKLSARNPRIFSEISLRMFNRPSSLFPTIMAAPQQGPYACHSH